MYVVFFCSLLATLRDVAVSLVVYIPTIATERITNQSWHTALVELGDRPSGNICHVVQSGNGKFLYAISPIHASDARVFVYGDNTRIIPFRLTQRNGDVCARWTNGQHT